ncbi:MAG: carboxypeptidase regulatory-like domain-containing protein, partial [Gemmatimonadales bacterium]
MTENRRIAFGRMAKVMVAVALLAFGATELGAQGTTGKIQGTVIDPTGQPVANAQVFILGTAFAALTNDEGYYFFNNVPAGTYDLRAQFIGYQPAEVRGIRVLTEQTLTVNFGLSGAVALEAITITAAETPIVPRDQVTSKSIVTGETIDQLPVDDPRQVLTLQPGVVESGDGLGVSIRGGRPGEAVVYIDGVPVRRLRTGAAEINIATNATEEASVTTGALGAEFGDAQSGVISLVTRSGGPRFQGTLSYETDEVFGDGIKVGFNRFEGTLSGPIFGNLTFFVGGTLQGQQSDFRGKGWDEVPTYVLGGLDTAVTVTDEDGNETALDVPEFVQYSGQCDASANLGIECQGRRLPYDWTSNWRANAKLTYTYGSGSRFAISALWDQDQNRLYAGSNIFNPEAYAGTRTNSQVYILNWVQQVFRTAETELAFDLNLSWQTDRQRGGVLDRDWELANRDPSLGISLSTMQFLIDFDHFSQEEGDDPRTLMTLSSQDDWDVLVKNVQDNLGTRLPYLLRDDLRSNQAYRRNPYALSTGFRTGGIDDVNPRLDYDRRAIGRLNVDWQFDRYNRLKFGGEGQLGRVSTFSSDPLRQIFQDVYSEDPTRFAAYIQDRLDLGDVVLELGLRWDYFDTRALFPLTPARIFTHPAYDPDVPIEDLTCVGAECDEPDAGDNFVWKQA